MVPWLHTEEILSRFSTDSSRAIERYIDFVEQGIAGQNVWTFTKAHIKGES